VEDGRALGRVVDFEPTDDLCEQVEALTEVVELLDEWLGVGGLLDGGDLLIERVELLLERIERGAFEEKLDARLAHLVEGLDGLLLELVDAIEVDVAHVAQRDQMAALITQLGHRTQIALDLVPAVGTQPANEIALLLLGLFERIVGVLLENLHLLELVDDELGGVSNLVDERLEAAEVVAEPLQRETI